ncbi:MAG: hypothetical protein IJE09_05155, partial [Oscillospiraceae bacterium]|nr:hypothetical protein [Oscillospiraceae bacterium]
MLPIVCIYNPLKKQRQQMLSLPCCFDSVLFFGLLFLAQVELKQFAAAGAIDAAFFQGLLAEADFFTADGAGGIVDDSVLLDFFVIVI